MNLGGGPVATSIDIYDPDLYVDGPIHEIFADLRRTDPTTAASACAAR